MVQVGEELLCSSGHHATLTIKHLASGSEDNPSLEWWCSQVSKTCPLVRRVGYCAPVSRCLSGTLSSAYRGTLSGRKFGSPSRGAQSGEERAAPR
jgi:hypothetical protein